MYLKNIKFFEIRGDKIEFADFIEFAWEKRNFIWIYQQEETICDLSFKEYYTQLKGVQDDKNIYASCKYAFLVLDYLLFVQGAKKMHRKKEKTL